jgi:flagellar biosynthetic protein FlhB
MADTEDKTEAPTSKRRSEARQKGDVPRSTEINSALVLIAGIVLIRIYAADIYLLIGDCFRSILGMVAHPEMSTGTLMKVTIDGIVLTGKIVLPICIGILCAGVLANIVQVGFLITTKPLEPSLEKINPLSGFKRLVSLRSVVELAKNILKIAIVSFVAYITLKGKFSEALMMGDATVGAIMLFLLNVTFTIFLRVAIVLLILAIFDYAYQRWENEKKLRMSHQEVKDEHKQMEGDPKIKARIRSLQMEMARRRMMREVPKATVVVTNPTHIAIALRYVPAEMRAPVVIAKGKRLIAEKIKAIAQENRIPIVEDKPLARALFPRVEPGDEVPADFYAAVAEILAYVYRLRDKRAA